MTLVFPNHVRRVPNKMDSLVWNMKLSSHISSVNYFTSAVKENRCNEQLIIQNNHPLNPIPLLNIFGGRSAMVGFTHNVNWVHWPVFHVGPHQPSCTPHLWGSRQLPAPSTWPLTVQYHIQRQIRIEVQCLDVTHLITWASTSPSVPVLKNLSAQGNKIRTIKYPGQKKITIVSKVDHNQQWKWGHMNVKPSLQKTLMFPKTIHI